MLCAGGIPSTLTSIVLMMSDGFFRLCWSERLGRAVHKYPIHPHPHPLPHLSRVPNRPCVVSGDVRQYSSLIHSQPVWPSGNALSVWLADDVGSLPCFCNSPIASLQSCGLWTLSCDVHVPRTTNAAVNGSHRCPSSKSRNRAGGEVK